MKIQEIQEFLNATVDELRYVDFKAEMKFAGKKQKQFINLVVNTILGNNLIIQSGFEKSWKRDNYKTIKDYLCVVSANPKYLLYHWLEEMESMKGDYVPFEDWPEDYLKEAILLDVINRVFWITAHELDNQRAMSLDRYIIFSPYLTQSK